MMLHASCQKFELKSNGRKCSLKIRAKKLNRALNEKPSLKESSPIFAAQGGVSYVTLLRDQNQNSDT